MSTFYMREEDFVPGEQIEHYCGCCGEKILPKDESNRTGPWCHEGRRRALASVVASCEMGSELDSPICRIEFLRAWDDNTWDTIVLEVPPNLFHDKATDEARIEWAKRVCSPPTDYGHPDVVLWAVYNLDPL